MKSFFALLSKAFGISIVLQLVLGAGYWLLVQILDSFNRGELSCNFIDSVRACGIVEFLVTPPLAGLLVALLYNATLAGAPVIVVTIIVMIVLRIRRKSLVQPSSSTT